jgi:hypothetical protein
VKFRCASGRAASATVAVVLALGLLLATALTTEAPAIPPLCVTDNMPCSPPNPVDGSEDVTGTFDAGAVEPGGAAGDTAFSEGDTLGGVVSDGNERASGYHPVQAAYVHCSYRHHKSHHRRLKNGALQHHYHNSSTVHSFWTTYNADIYESYRNRC